MSDVPRIVRNDWSTLPVPELGGWRPELPVSVVIPAYNCQPSLDLLLASLTQQTYPADLLEVIVVDDGSQPRLRLPAARPVKTRLVWAPDYSDDWGIANACNIGVREASGQIIVRLDADMVVFPHHVEAHARWHHAVPYAVTLGAKRFVDVEPERPGWPAVADLVRAGNAADLFDRADSEPHEYVEKLAARTDQLRAADHLAFLAHVGATTGMRRELYERAGGFAAAIKRGSDTEFGYRLAQAGAVFVPETAADAWHLGTSNMMREAQALQRYSRPFLADAMPHPRWLRKIGGTAWAVPLVTAVVEVDGHPLEIVRAAVDALLRGDERDVRVLLVGRWETLGERHRRVLADPALDLRLIAATYRSDPRVQLVDRAPESVFPSPYLLRLPATAGLARAAIPRLIDEADQHQVGVVRVQVPGAEAPVELWRTAALSRAEWIRGDEESLLDVVTQTHRVRTLKAARAGVANIARIPAERLASGAELVAARFIGIGWLPGTIEVGGLRSWLRATTLVALLSLRKVVDAARRVSVRKGATLSDHQHR